MKWLIDSVGAFCANCLLKAKNLWDYGFGHSLSNPIKFIVDIILILIWSAIFIMFHANTYVTILGIAIVLCSLDKIFSLSGGNVWSSLVQPFVIIGLYTVAAIIFYWAIELVLIFSIIVLPIVTREIQENYNNYYSALTP